MICFIDTPGAFCGIAAEERGQGEAIARCLLEFCPAENPGHLDRPGGGRLAAARWRSGSAIPSAMLENAVYSVISPRGMRIDPLEGCLPGKGSSRGDEDDGGRPLSFRGLRHGHPRGAGRRPYEPGTDGWQYCRSFILDALKNLTGKSVANLLEARYNKFRKIGVFSEGGQLPPDSALDEPLPSIDELSDGGVSVSTEAADLKDVL